MIPSSRLARAPQTISLRYRFRRSNRPSLVSVCCFNAFLAFSVLVTVATASTYNAAFKNELTTAPLAQDENVMILELGKPIEGSMKADEATRYRLKLVADQYLDLVVDQQGIDVVVTLFGPDKQTLLKVDSPNGNKGPEPLSLIVKLTGTYLLEVRSLEKDAPAGRYAVTISEIRKATEHDRMSEKALGLFNEAEAQSENDDSDALRNSLEKYQAALALYKTASDRAGQARTLRRMASLQDSLKEPQKALDLYAQSLGLWRAVGNKEEQFEVLNTLGVIHETTGNFQESLDSYGQALALSKEIGEKSRMASIQLNLGALYFRLGEYQRAISYLNDAIANAHVSYTSRAEASGLMNLGNVYDALGEYAKAIASYEKALVLSRSAKLRKSEAMGLTNLADVYQNMGESQKAFEYYKQALEIKRALGARSSEAFTLMSMGFNFLFQRKHEKATEHFDQALVIFRDDGDRPSIAHALFGLAQAESDKGKLNDSRARIEEAIKISESLRTTIKSQELRATFFASVQTYYEFYIDLLMRLHKQNPQGGFDGEALQISERARARSLIELLQEAHANIKEGVDPQLLAHETIFRQQLDDKSEEQLRLLAGRHTEAEAKEVTNQINELTSTLQQSEARIKQASPRYAAITQPQTLTLKEIQQNLLDDDTMLLEYSLGDERSYLWAVTPDRVTTYELPKRADIDALARKMYDVLTVRAKHDARETSEQQEIRFTAVDRQFEFISTQLSRAILSPAASLLGTKRLVIVADGAMQFVPFGALVDPVFQRAGRESVPLVVNHELVTLPSASTLAVLRRENADRKPAPKAIAVLADPVFSRDDVRLARTKGTYKRRGSRQQAATAANGGLPPVEIDVERALTDTDMRDAEKRIPRLFGTRREAEQILALVHGNQSMRAFDFVASRDTAMDASLKNFRILHFATHGMLNSTHPELSGLLFSMFDQRGNARNGFLRSHEVFNLKLDADLVVLSACQTGLGKEIKGEGVIGLTRGFMYAGAPRVVVSLWSVSDQATAELMADFYRGLLVKRLRPAAALRAAQVQMWERSRWQSPYYWAAFSLQGEWR